MKVLEGSSLETFVSSLESKEWKKQRNNDKLFSEHHTSTPAISAHTTQTHIHTLMFTHNNHKIEKKNFKD